MSAMFKLTAMLDRARREERHTAEQILILKERLEQQQFRRGELEDLADAFKKEREA